MMNRAAMKTSIFIQVLFTIIFQVVNGSINDFIIADKSDLKRVGGAEAVSNNEMEQIDDWGDSREDEYIYDSCYGGNAAEQYFDHSYGDYFEEGEAEEYNAIESMEDFFTDSNTDLQPDHIKEIMKKLSTDPRYVVLFEQAENVKYDYICPGCQDDYFEDMFMSDHNTGCN